VISNGAEHSQDRQEVPPENSGEGQALSLRHVPEAKPEAGEDPGSVVLPDLFELCEIRQEWRKSWKLKDCRNTPDH